MTPDLSAAAFFDVDNTLMRGASIYYFARGLAARKYFRTADLLRFGLRQLRFRVTANENSADMSLAKESALAFVAGRPVAELARLGEEIFDELIAERIWRGTLAIARRHLAQGEQVWLITAAPAELGKVIADRLGLTGALGSVAEIVNGCYTGRMVGELMHGPAKAIAIEELAAREGLDLGRCSAYSDSINDLPMLTTVGHPVAVNPDAPLRRHARENGWEIRDFRTGRKTAKVIVPAALAAGGVAGAVAAIAAFNRRSGHRGPAGAETDAE